MNFGRALIFFTLLNLLIIYKLLKELFILIVLKKQSF